MSDVDETEELFSRIVEETGGFDILVNNAGTTARGPAYEIELADWRRVIKVNLTSVFAMSQTFARHRTSVKAPGKIANTASLMSEQIKENNSPYAASKGEIRRLTKALAVDWAPHPGSTSTRSARDASGPSSPGRSGRTTSSISGSGRKRPGVGGVKHPTSAVPQSTSPRQLRTM